VQRSSPQGPPATISSMPARKKKLVLKLVLHEYQWCAGEGVRTLCIWSKLSDEQYVHVTPSSLYIHSAAVDAWHACAVILPKGHFKSVHRSRRSTTYCTIGSSLPDVEGAAEAMARMRQRAANSNALVRG
jgi:hypothetical protein